jgi:hypothetical protein
MGWAKKASLRCEKIVFFSKRLKVVHVDRGVLLSGVWKKLEPDVFELMPFWSFFVHFSPKTG